MSRPIKFRAWGERIDHFQVNYVHGQAITDEMLPPDAFSFNGNGEFTSSTCRYKVLHLMQFTGLKDVKNVEIYEGDVVYLAGYGDYVVEFPFTELYEAYGERDIGAIKGNIYENPEVLEAK